MPASMLAGYAIALPAGFEPAHRWLYRLSYGSYLCDPQPDVGGLSTRLTGLEDTGFRGEHQRPHPRWGATYTTSITTPGRRRHAIWGRVSYSRLGLEVLDKRVSGLRFRTSRLAVERCAQSSLAPVVSPSAPSRSS